jgi:Tfp pilus assembly protein PilN
MRLPASSILLPGPAVVTTRLADALAARDVRVATTLDPESWAARVLDGMERRVPLTLRPPARQRAWELTRRRLALALWSGAAACLVLAAGVELVGQARELRALQGTRRTLTADLAVALQSRQAVERLVAQESVTRAISHAPKWTAILTSLAEALPFDASLTSVVAHHDSVHVEGIAANATEVLAAFRAVSGVRGVGADAPIRQEDDEGARVERFSVTLLLGTAGPTVPLQRVARESTR